MTSGNGDKKDKDDDDDKDPGTAGGTKNGNKPD